MENPNEFKVAESSGQDNVQQSPLSQQSFDQQQSVKKSNKKTLFLALLGIALLVVGAGTWYLIDKKSDPTSKVAVSPKTAQTAPPSHSPYNLVYFTTQKTGRTPNGCGELEQTKLFVKPSLSSSMAASGASLAPGFGISFHDISARKVAFVTNQSCGATGNSEVWYSGDSGKSYTKVFTVTAKQNSSYDELTSLKFASDEKSLLIAVLHNDQDVTGYKNTVKQIDLSTKAVTDIASFGSAGVFIEGFDSRSQTMYYWQGCFNCDGFSPDTILAYDVAKKSTSTFYHNTTGLGDRIIFNKDFTKALYARGTSGESLGDGPPYSIDEIDAQSMQTQKVATRIDALSALGFRTDDDAAYYSDGKSVYTFSDGSSAIAFTPSASIQTMYGYSKNKAVMSVGSGIDTYEYDTQSKSETKLLHSESAGQVLGVAWN